MRDDRELPRNNWRPSAPNSMPCACVPWPISARTTRATSAGSARRCASAAGAAGRC
ncbi:hypothetical protein ACPA9J_04735 [Pseudomonas aeruginosa]